MSSFLIRVIRLYQVCLSPFLSGGCRFVPTCSEYACEAFSSLTLGRAFWRVIRRISSCHPFHPGGWDPLESI